jgi:hypothetical protein
MNDLTRFTRRKYQRLIIGQSQKIAVEILSSNNDTLMMDSISNLLN